MSLAGSSSSVVDQLVAISKMCSALENSDMTEGSALADPGVLWKLRRDYSSEQQSHLYGNCTEVRNCVEQNFVSHPQASGDVIQWQQFNKAVQQENASKRCRSHKD